MMAVVARDAVQAWWWRGGDPMGKSAVATVMAALLWPVAVALFVAGGIASPSLRLAGDSLQVTWAVLTFVSVATFFGSYLPSDRQDQRVAETAALLLLALTQVAYIAAIEETTDLASPLAQALGAALTVNAVGRGVLLVRCWAAVRRARAGTIALVRSVPPAGP